MLAGPAAAAAVQLTQCAEALIDACASFSLTWQNPPAAATTTTAAACLPIHCAEALVDGLCPLEAD
jgi:hypothetical protein